MKRSKGVCRRWKMFYTSRIRRWSSPNLYDSILRHGLSAAARWWTKGLEATLSRPTPSFCSARLLRIATLDSLVSLLDSTRTGGHPKPSSPDRSTPIFHSEAGSDVASVKVLPGPKQFSYSLRWLRVGGHISFLETRSRQRR